MNIEVVNSLNFIELKDICFEYKKEKEIIKNINLNIEKDEVTAIVGANGSGKTTLGKLMMGILKPKSGEIRIYNTNISEISLAQIGSKIGYLFQNPEKHFFTNTVEEELVFVLKFQKFDDIYIKEKIDSQLKLFKLEGLRNQSPLLLSQGEKQRLAIATILISNPEYLILDEPTTGLDMERKNILVEVLKELIQRGIGLTLISHDNSFIKQLSHRVIEIHKGEVIYDKRV